MSLMNRCSKDAVLLKGRWTGVQRLFLTSQMPRLGRAQQPSRQCTMLGTTPERIKESFVVPRAKATLLLVA
jgi:hypothetical protein